MQPGDLALRPKGHTGKLALANQLRTETIVPMSWISQRLHLGTAQSARSRLRTWKTKEATRETENELKRHWTESNPGNDVAML